MPAPDSPTDGVLEVDAAQLEEAKTAIARAWEDLPGADDVSPELLEAAARTVLDAADNSLHWEYSPGHIRPDGKAFVQSGVIAPGYVAHYVDEGGGALRRLVTEYEAVTAETVPPASDPECCDACRKAVALGFTPSRVRRNP